MGMKKYYTIDFEVDNEKVDSELRFKDQAALEDALADLIGNIHEYDHVRIASPERGVLRMRLSSRRDFIRAIVPIIRGRRGQYPSLESQLERMPMTAQRELMLLLRDMEEEINLG